MKDWCLYEIIKMCDINIRRSTPKIGGNLYINIYRNIYIYIYCCFVDLTCLRFFASFFCCFESKCNPKFASGQDRFLPRTCTFHAASIISFQNTLQKVFLCHIKDSIHFLRYYHKLPMFHLSYEMKTLRRSWVDTGNIYFFQVLFVVLILFFQFGYTLNYFWIKKITENEEHWT